MKRVVEIAAWAAVLAMAVLAGCEGTVSDTSGNTILTMEPSSTTIEGGTSNVAFKVQGGYAPYAWSVDDTNLGSVASAGDMAVYISNTVTGVNVVTATDSRSNAVGATVTQP